MAGIYGNWEDRLNPTVNDKIGEPTDFAAHETVLGYNNSLYQHAHQPAKCYPTLADGVVVAGGAGAWALGNFVEVIPANAINKAFDIHYINVEAASANDVYEIVLYSGLLGAEVEIGRARTYKTAAIAGANSVQVQVPAQLANTRVSAKVASSSGGDSLTVSTFYHTYE